MYYTHVTVGGLENKRQFTAESYLGSFVCFSCEKTQSPVELGRIFITTFFVAKMPVKIFFCHRKFRSKTSRNVTRS